MIKKPNKKLAVLGAALIAFAATAPRTGMAMVAPPDSTVPGQSSVQRAEDLSAIKTALQQKIVRSRLQEMGLKPAEIENRLGSLSDSELQMVATHIDNENPGGDAAGLVVTLLLIGILAWFFVHLIHDDPHL